MEFQKFIKKEPKEEEEEEEEETDEEDEEEEEEEVEEEAEGEGAGCKVLGVEEKWKLQHTEEWKTEPLEKLGMTFSIHCALVVCSV